MNKLYSTCLFLVSCLLFLLPASARAMCPICTVAAGTGVVLFRNWGIDDAITGVWIGGLLISTTMWTINWLQSRKIHFIGRNFLTGAIYFALILIPFYQKNLISQKIFGDHFQTLFGVDKLLLGIIAGSLSFLFGATLYNLFKKNNGGKAVFPFSKVVLPISPLIILSVIFYFLTK